MTHLCFMTRVAYRKGDSFLVLGLGYIRTLGGTANLIRPRLVSFPITTRLSLISTRLFLYIINTLQIFIPEDQSVARTVRLPPPSAH